MMRLKKLKDIYEMSIKEKAQVIENIMNTTSRKGQDEIATYLSWMHPTLQQNFMATAMKFIEVQGAKTDGRFDLRNQATVEFCRQVLDKIEAEDAIFPFI